MNKEDIKVGAYYTDYSQQGWCRHGIFRTTEHDGKIQFVDTYWNDMSVSVDHFDISNLIYVGQVEDFKECSADEYWLYSKRNRIYIPIGGWRERYLIKKDAEREYLKVIANIENAIKKLEFDIEWAEKILTGKKLWLEYIKANPDRTDEYKDWMQSPPNAIQVKINISWEEL